MLAFQLTTKDFINQMTDDFINQLEFLIDDFHDFMSTIAGILVLIFVVYKVVLYMTNLEKGLDPYIIIRPCLLLVGIVLYQNLVETFLITPMSIISQVIENSIVDLTGIDSDSFSAKFNSSMTRTDDRLYDVLQINPILELLHLIIYFVGSFVSYYMLIKQSLSIGIYYVMGYLSILFSLIPGNEKSFLNWCLSFLAILLWEPFIVILKYLTILTRIDSTSFTSFFVIVAVQITVIFLFLKVPSFCEFLINSGSPLGSPHASGSVSSFRKISSSISSLKSYLSSKKSN
jgi:hypothetical protein